MLNPPVEQAAETLSVEDLRKEVSTCQALDPGPDPSFDHDVIPEIEEDNSPAEKSSEPVKKSSSTAVKKSVA